MCVKGNVGLLPNQAMLSKPSPDNLFEDNFSVAFLKNGWVVACCAVTRLHLGRRMLQDGHGEHGHLVSGRLVQVLPPAPQRELTFSTLHAFVQVFAGSQASGSGGLYLLLCGAGWQVKAFASAIVHARV